MQWRSLLTRNLAKTNAHLYFARDRLYTRQIRCCKKKKKTIRREAKDWSAYCENSREWCWSFVWLLKWRESNSGREQRCPVPDQYYNCNCHPSARRVLCYRYRRVVSHPEYFLVFLFFFFFYSSSRHRGPARAHVSTNDERKRRRNALSATEIGWVEEEEGCPLFHHRIKWRALRRSKRYSTCDRWRDQ